MRTCDRTDSQRLLAAVAAETGNAIAQAFAHEGAQAVIAGRDGREGTLAAKEIAASCMPVANV